MPDWPRWPACLSPDRRAVLTAYDIVMPEQIRGLMGEAASRARLAAVIGLTDDELRALDAWLVAQGLDPKDHVASGPVQFDFEGGEGDR